MDERPQVAPNQNLYAKRFSIKLLKCSEKILDLPPKPHYTLFIAGQIESNMTSIERVYYDGRKGKVFGADRVQAAGEYGREPSTQGLPEKEGRRCLELDGY